VFVTQPTERFPLPAGRASIQRGLVADGYGHSRVHGPRSNESGPLRHATHLLQVDVTVPLDNVTERIQSSQSLSRSEPRIVAEIYGVR